MMEFETYFRSREERRITRQALTGKHGFKAVVEISGARIHGEMTDFSSLGFALTVPSEESDRFKIGASFKLEVSPLINQYYPVQGILIDKQPAKDGQIKLSAVVSHEQSNRHGDFEPIHLSAEQSLKGQMLHPFIYKQTTYFEVESLSKNGFYLTDIHPEFTLFDNMEVEFSIGNVLELQSVKGRVSNVSLTEENRIRCFIEPNKLSVKAEIEIGQHCFHFAQKTPREISNAGIDSRHIKEIVHYRFVETQPEYEAVLKLRRKAYALRGLCRKDEPIVKFAMEQDAYGRILIAFHNARVIGSATLVIGEQGDKPFELEHLLDTQSFSALPAYSETMEVAALCVERHYQETDVMHGIFENIYREGLSAGKKYIVAASEPSFVSQYENMGFKRTGHKFEHPAKKDLAMSVMLLNKDTGTSGKGMNPILWWEVWGAVSWHLYQRRIIEYTTTQKARVYLSRLMSKIGVFFKHNGRSS